MRVAVTLISIGIVAGITPAAAQSINDLMATPKIAEIAARWASVCVANAGNPGKQKQAVKDQGLTWPYQVMFLKDQGQPSCALASSTETATTADGLAEAVQAQFAGQPLAGVTKTATSVTASVVIAGKSFRIVAGLQKPGSNVVAVIALTEMEKVK